MAKLLSGTTVQDFDLYLVGHADHRGDKAMNMALSKRRAEAVRDRLIKLGIAKERIVAEGKGPLPGTSELEMHENRRVELRPLRAKEVGFTDADTIPTFTLASGWILRRGDNGQLELVDPEKTTYAVYSIKRNGYHWSYYGRSATGFEVDLVVLRAPGQPLRAARRKREPAAQIGGTVMGVAVEQTTEGEQGAPALLPLEAPAVRPAPKTTVYVPPPQDKPMQLSFGADLLGMVPVGNFADATGPLIGVVARVGLRLRPEVELTARFGYLSGLSKTQYSGGHTWENSVSDIPLWLGVRCFFGPDPYEGPYVDAEFGLNVLSSKVTASGASASETNERIGFHMGGGYIVSKAIPIDLHLQLMYVNLPDPGEKAALAVGVGIGYTYRYSLGSNVQANGK